MKRSLFVLCVLASASLASAQSAPDSCDVQFAQKFFRPDTVALEHIATTCNYEIVYPSADDLPTQIVNLGGKQFDNVHDAVQAVLEGVPYRYAVNSTNHTITVQRGTSDDALNSTRPRDTRPANQPAPTTTEDRSQQHQSVDPMEDLQQRYQHASSMAELNQVTWEIGEMRNRREIAEYANRRPYAYGSASTPYDNFGGYLNYDIVREQMTRNLRYEETWGSLKFKKGSERLFTNIEVHCGSDDYVGGAANANNFYDHKMLIETSCGPQLELQYTDMNGKRWAIVFHTRIVPISVQRALHEKGTEIVLTEQQIASAHELKSYTQHIWVEKKP